MSRPDGPLLVLGVGNVLLRDEGVGVRIVRELDGIAADDRVDLPPGTRLLDGGTLGLDLLPIIADSRALVIVDAVDLGRRPGAVEVIRGASLQGVLAAHVSPHQVGVGDLLAAARLIGQLPASVVLVGIQPGEIAIGLELTDAVEAAVPVAVGVLLDELAMAHSTTRERAVGPPPMGGSAGERTGRVVPESRQPIAAGRR